MDWNRCGSFGEWDWPLLRVTPEFIFLRHSRSTGVEEGILNILLSNFFKIERKPTGKLVVKCVKSIKRG